MWISTGVCQHIPFPLVKKKKTTTKNQVALKYVKQNKAKLLTPSRRRNNMTTSI